MDDLKKLSQEELNQWQAALRDKLKAQLEANSQHQGALPLHHDQPAGMGGGLPHIMMMATNHPSLRIRSDSATSSEANHPAAALGRNFTDVTHVGAGGGPSSGPSMDIFEAGTFI